MSRVEGRRITLEKAARAMLGRERDDDEESQRGSRPPPKVTLAKLSFMERPMPSWQEPPRPVRPSQGG
jgi:hypothetical protein